MIHDTLEERQEYISHLKSIGEYNPMASATDMQIGHTAYWIDKDKQAGLDRVEAMCCT
jgi:hypothetical protein